MHCCNPMETWVTHYHGAPDFRNEWWVGSELPPFSHCPWCGEPILKPEPADPGSDT